MDSSWNPVTTVTNTVELTSSDASASIPGAASLLDGEGVFLVTINAVGNFTFSVTDQSDPTIPEATSSPVNATAFRASSSPASTRRTSMPDLPCPSR